MFIKQIYHPHPKIIHEDATVKDVVVELLKDEINGLVVLNNHSEVIGVISMQDIAGATIPDEFRKNIAMAQAMYKQGYFQEMCEKIADMPVKKFMRTEFVTVDFDTNIMAVTADFLENDLYIVPVVEGNRLMGVITRTEIKQAIAAAMGVVHKQPVE